MRDPNACLGVDPRFRAKGHGNKRAEKTLDSVFQVFGFWGSGNQSSLHYVFYGMRKLVH
jgi:hypothetical protein